MAGWSVVGFLNHTKTFHDFFAIFTGPAVAPVVTFLVGYGHLLIGLSLLVGLMVRISASFGILLMLLYWLAHMDFPYIENAMHRNWSWQLKPLAKRSPPKRAIVRRNVWSGRCSMT